MASDTDQDFSTELHQRTKHEHSVSDIIVRLVAPLVLSDRQLYRLLVKGFYYVYKTFEEELDTQRRKIPRLRVIYFTELLRAAAFEEDLAFYYGKDWRECIGMPSKATAEYIKRVKEISIRDPLLLIAYAQTMYLGILAGGKTIQLWCEKALKLEKDGRGVAIYKFDKIQDMKAFKKRYRETINVMRIEREEKERIIEEKKMVFALNDSLINEVRNTAMYKRRIAYMGFRVLLLVILLWLAVRYFAWSFLWAFNYVLLGSAKR